MGADEIDNQYYQQFLLKPFFDKNKIKTEANQNSYIRTQHRVNQVNGKGFCSLMNDDDNEPIKVYTFEESSIQIFDNVVGSISKRPDTKHMSHSYIKPTAFDLT